MGSRNSRNSTINYQMVFDLRRVHFFYVMSCDGVYKVGHSRNIFQRMSTIQIGNAREIRLAAFCMFAVKWPAEVMEREVLESLSDRKIRGEWLDVPLGAIAKEARNSARRHDVGQFYIRDGLAIGIAYHEENSTERNQVARLARMHLKGIAKEIDLCYKNENP